MFFDGVIAAGAERQRAGAGRLEPQVSVTPPQPHDPQTGSIAPLRVRATLQNPGNELSGRRSDLVGPADQARRRPLGMRAVGAGHVLGHGRRLSVVAPPMRRHALVAMEDLDRVGRVADLDLLADQLVRHAVDVMLDGNVVVNVHAARLPVREDVACDGQGPQRRAVELLVEGAAADAQLLHRPVVESSSSRTRTAALSAPSSKKVARFPRPRRDDDRAVVGGQVLVGAVDAGLVAAGSGDGALQLVGDPHRGGAAEVLHHADVRVDPVRQLLGSGRLGVGEATGAEHRDEQLDRPQLARAPVDQARPLAREVDEGLLAGAVDLSHRRPQPLDRSPVELAELRVAVAARMDLKVLLPEQLQRDAVALQFPVDLPHQQPPCRHRLAPPVERAKACWIRGYRRAFTMTEIGVQLPEIGVQLPPKSVFNFPRKTHRPGPREPAPAVRRR